VYEVAAKLLEQHVLPVEAKSIWVGGVEVESERQNQRVDICGE
jgi:hypothetical protein